MKLGLGCEPAPVCPSAGESRYMTNNGTNKRIKCTTDGEIKNINWGRRHLFVYTRSMNVVCKSERNKSLENNASYNLIKNKKEKEDAI